MLSPTTKEDIINLKNSSQNTTQDLKGDLNDVANNAGRKVRNMFNSASDEISHASDKVTTEIHSNPVRSSMIALGIGVVLGALLAARFKMEKLLAIASLGQRAYGRWLFQRLLSGIIMAAGLAIVTSIMVGALLVGSLWAVYFALHYYGIGQAVAMMITGAAAIAAIAVLIFLTLACLGRLRRMPRTLLKQSPLTARAMDALDAFSNGLMAD